MPYAKKQCLFCDAFFEPTSGRQQVCPVLECQLWLAEQPNPGETPEQTYKRTIQRKATVRYRFANPPDLERKAEDGRRWRAGNPEKARASDQASKAKRRENDLDGVRRSERLKRRRQRAADPEKARADGRKSNRRHREKYPDEGRILSAKWRAENPERHRANVKRWRLENPDKAHAAWALRRAREKNAPNVEVVNRQIVADRDNWVCGLCDGPIDPAATYMVDGEWNPWYLNIDHIIPLTKGGDHTYENVQAAHALCNSRKNNRMQSP